MTLKDMKENCFIYCCNVVILNANANDKKAYWGKAIKDMNDWYPMEDVPFCIEDCIVKSVMALSPDESKKYGFTNAYGTILIFAYIDEDDVNSKIKNYQMGN